MFVRNNKNDIRQPKRLFGRKSLSIDEVYKKIEMRIKEKKHQQAIKSVPYSQRYPETLKIYSSRIASSSKEKSQRNPLNERRNINTASASSRNINCLIDFPKKRDETEVNLFVTEGRRQMVFQILSSKKQERKSGQVFRTKSARTISRNQSMKGIAFRDSEIPNLPKKTKKVDDKTEKVLECKLNLEGVSTRQNNNKRKIRHKIIVFQQGILLRNKY